MGYFYANICVYLKLFCKYISLRTINRIFCGLLSAKNYDFNDFVM